MSVIHNDLLLATDEATGYNLTKSLRTRASASAYLNRTPASAGNRKTWTWSSWVKRGTLGSTQMILSAGVAQPATDGLVSLRFESGDTLRIVMYESGTGKELNTTQVFRDPSAWYHIVVTLDTTQATSSNRLKFYVNGSQITAFATANYPTQNYDFGVNNTQTHNISRYYYDPVSNPSYFDGYMAEVNFVDGSALTPSSFGETDTITGVWKPKRYTGTYGTNGFYLPFTDVATTSGSNAGLGKDFSGNGNYWTTNNISVTTGSTYDSMTDVPTLTSATTANYNTLNPAIRLYTVTPAEVITDGNLTLTCSSSGVSGSAYTTQVVSSGKWYFESTIGAVGVNCLVGFNNNTLSAGLGTWAGDARVYGAFYQSNGQKWVANTGSSYGATYTTGDVIGAAIDVGAGTVEFFKNNTSQGVISGLSIYSGSLGWLAAVEGFNGTVHYTNFGQRPFAYTPPTGYVALNTYNLPDSTIVAGNKVMDATLYTGNSSTQTITTQTAFKPDFVWIKDRTSSGRDHRLLDTVRGATKTLYSDLTNAEATEATGLTAFTSTGFTLGSENAYNGSGDAYVSWNWQAGQGTTSSNTDGSITSTVSVNASAGFSVVTYTGTGANATVGHGLGVAPKFIVIKDRDYAYNWINYHASLGSQGYLHLNTSDAAQYSSAIWNDTAPTSTVFSLGSANGNANTNGHKNVAYCWSEIAGFSKFGSYTGNGSTDGVFVYTGFKPKFVIIKCTSDAGQQWLLLDSSRSSYNVAQETIFPDSSGAEQSNPRLDFLSNGIKIRNTYGNQNTSGSNYVYACFAENPFKNSLAR